MDVLTSSRVRDPRYVRYESTELLARVFRDRLCSSSTVGAEAIQHGLTGDDVRFLVRAIVVVATFTTTYALDQETEEQQRQRILAALGAKLNALD